MESRFVDSGFTVTLINRLTKYVYTLKSFVISVEIQRTGNRKLYNIK